MFVCLFLCTCMYIYLSLCMHVFMSGSVCLSLCMYACLDISACLSLCMRMYVYVCVSVSIYEYVYMRVYMCVCVPARTRTLSPTEPARQAHENSQWKARVISREINKLGQCAFAGKQTSKCFFFPSSLFLVRFFFFPPKYSAITKKNAEFIKLRLRTTEGIIRSRPIPRNLVNKGKSS